MGEPAATFESWQALYSRLIKTLFEEGENNLIFSAFSADVQEAWARLVNHWEDDPQGIEAIQAKWTKTLDAYRQAQLTPRANPILAVKDLDSLHRSLGQCLEQTISDAPGLSEADEKLLSFCVRQLLNAMATAHWPMTNEEVVKEAFDSKGMSMLNGIKNFQEHLVSGRSGFDVQTTSEAFVPGENLAITPGEVVYQNPLFQLIQYYPFRQEVSKEPLLIIPPWINKYYILDLTPQDSLVQWAVKQGHTVFMMSWANPGSDQNTLGLGDYLTEGAVNAIKQVQEISKYEKVNVLGFCIGGLLAGMTAAWLQEKKYDCLNSLTLLNTMLDYSDPGELGVFLSERIIRAIDEVSRPLGLFKGKHLRRAFTVIREDRMFWPYVVNNYYLGKSPRPHPMLFWNQDSVDLPYPMFMTYMNDMYRDNKLFKQDDYKIAGESIKIKTISLPVYAVASKKDPIVPWKAAFSSVAPMEDVVFVLSDAGHIVGVVNPPSKNRYAYWQAAITHGTGSADTWLAGADRHSGSWWAHWAEWLSGLSDGKLRARFPAETAGSQIEKAPGSYVKNSRNL